MENKAVSKSQNIGPGVKPWGPSLHPIFTRPLQALYLQIGGDEEIYIESSAVYKESSGSEP